MSRDLTRRRFLGSALTASAAAAATAGSVRAEPAAPAQGAKPAEPKPGTGPLPTGKIGDLEISRMLLGGNLLTHYTHSRDLRYVYNLTKQYNTREKIFQTMALAESQGINTLVIHTAADVMDMLKEYRNKRGGKIQWIICPTAPIEPGLVKYAEQVQQIVDDGVDAVYLWGVRADQLVKQQQVDLIGKAVDTAKAQGVPSGVGAHDLAVVQECEKQGIRADFYIKTLHHHKYKTGPRPDEISGPVAEFPGYWCSQPQETIDFMKEVKKPWLAFKVMAAGAIPPKDAFRYALEGGADFVLAGMFDFEIADDVQIFKQVLGSKLQRARPWVA